MDLKEVVRALTRAYGKPAAPRWTDPFALVLLENAAYLVDDERRAEVFAALVKQVGLTPQAILSVKPARLAKVIARGGPYPALRAEKLHRAAMVALSLPTLAATMRDEPAKARKLLQKFPGIGEPGADKLLLLARCARTLAPDSNVLRVLERLGFVTARANYGQTYRAAAEAVADQLPAKYDALITARELLRRHGQELCRRTTPRCSECVLAPRCPFAAPAPARRRG